MICNSQYLLSFLAKIIAKSVPYRFTSLTSLPPKFRIFLITSRYEWGNFSRFSRIILLPTKYWCYNLNSWLPKFKSKNKKFWLFFQYKHSIIGLDLRNSVSLLVKLYFQECDPSSLPKKIPTFLRSDRFENF